MCPRDTWGRLDGRGFRMRTCAFGSRTDRRELSARPRSQKPYFFPPNNKGTRGDGIQGEQKGKQNVTLLSKISLKFVFCLLSNISMLVTVDISLGFHCSGGGGG